jgi:type I site-specific restriction endonuclease
MTAITDSDLKKLEDLINNRFDKLEERLQVLETGQKTLEVGLTEVRTKLTCLEPSVQKIPDLAEKVGELKNWKQIAVITLTALISSIVTGSIGGAIGWFLRGGNRA